MSNSFGLFFGGLIAIVLLALFALTTGYMAIEVANCDASTQCPDFGKGITSVVTTVGGLVSALVIAQLSVLQPGGPARIVNFTPVSTGGIITTNVVIALYLLVWTAAGLTALVVGVMFYPDRSSTLADIGTTWLGLAVSAAYAFFGIKPPAPAEERSDRSFESLMPVGSAAELQAAIDAKRIIFDPGKTEQLTKELLGTAAGITASPKLQKLVLALIDLKNPLRISSIVRTSGHHGSGRAVDIGNEEIASDLLPLVATDAKVAELGIDEIIFDATTAGQTNANIWNYDQGRRHAYDAATLADHRDHIHFAVVA